MAKKLVVRAILALLVALCASCAVAVALNHLNTDFSDLSDTDRQILSELDAFCKANASDPVWEGFDLENKPILAIGGALKNAYLVNPTGEVGGLFAAKIEMPQDSALRVYRVSFLAPQTLSTRFEVGNFNTLDKTYTVFGSDVYFIRYDRSTSIEAPNSSRHCITLLTHEAFHYYMQNQWSSGSRFEGELSERDVDLLAEEYDALAGIQAQLLTGAPDRDALIRYARDYVDAMERRQAANPEYVQDELSMETCEGTAQYVGICASRIVGYDYGVMYFDNARNVPLSDVVPVFRQGGIDESFLADKMPYQTGALLCQLLDALDAPDWQQRLNAQTPQSTTTLFALVRDYLDSIADAQEGAQAAQ